MIIKTSIIKSKSMLYALFFIVEITKHTSKIIRFPFETSCMYFIPNTLQV